MKAGIEITTWEDVCKVNGQDPVASLAFAAHLPEEDRAYMTAIYKLTKASKALGGNEDPTDYYPVFDTDDEDDPSGFSFSNTNYDNWNTNTNVSAHQGIKDYKQHRPCQHGKTSQTLERALVATATSWPGSKSNGITKP